MRPRKRVLLYCADYDRRNDLAFRLRVRCTWARIEAYRTIEEIAEELSGEPGPELGGTPRFDCVVLFAAIPGDRKADGQRRDGDGDDLVEKTEFDSLLQAPEVAGRTIEVRAAADWAKGRRQSLAAIFAAAEDFVALQDAMKTVAARKRGPKTQVRPPAPAVAEMAVA